MPFWETARPNLDELSEIELISTPKATVDSPITSKTISEEPKRFFSPLSPNNPRIPKLTSPSKFSLNDLEDPFEGDDDDGSISMLALRMGNDTDIHKAALSKLMAENDDDEVVEDQLLDLHRDALAELLSFDETKLTKLSEARIRKISRLVELKEEKANKKVKSVKIELPPINNDPIIITPENEHLHFPVEVSMPSPTSNEQRVYLAKAPTLSQSPKVENAPLTQPAIISEQIGDNIKPSRSQSKRVSEINPSRALSKRSSVELNPPPINENEFNLDGLTASLDTSEVKYVYSLALPTVDPLFPGDIFVKHNSVKFKNLRLYNPFMNNVLFNFIRSIPYINLIMVGFLLLYMIFEINLSQVAFTDDLAVGLIPFMLYLIIITQYWVYSHVECSFLLFRTASNFEFWWLLFWNVMFTTFTLLKALNEYQDSGLLQIYSYRTFYAASVIQKINTSLWLLSYSLYDTMPELDFRFKYFGAFFTIFELFRVVLLDYIWYNGSKGYAVCSQGYCLESKDVIISAMSILVIYISGFIFKNLYTILFEHGKKLNLFFISTDIRIDEIKAWTADENIIKVLDYRFSPEYNKPYPVVDEKETSISLESNFLKEFCENGLYSRFEPFFGHLIYRLYANYKVTFLLAFFAFVYVVLYTFFLTITSGAQIFGFVFTFLFIGLFFLIPFDRTVVFNVMYTFEFFYFGVNAMFCFGLNMAIYYNSIQYSALYNNTSEDLMLGQQYARIFYDLCLNFLVLILDGRRKGRWGKIVMLLLYIFTFSYRLAYFAFIVPYQTYNGAPVYENIEICVGPSGICLRFGSAIVTTYLVNMLLGFHHLICILFYEEATILLKAKWTFKVHNSFKCVASTDYLSKHKAELEAATSSNIELTNFTKPELKIKIDSPVASPKAINTQQSSSKGLFDSGKKKYVKSIEVNQFSYIFPSNTDKKHATEIEMQNV